jgi:hypothetical protein
MAGKGGKKGKNGKTGKTQIKGKAKTGKTQARNSNPPETPEREGQHGSSASVAEAEAEAVAEDSSSSPSSDSYCLPEDAAALPTAPVPNASRTTLLTARIFNYEPPVRGASADAAASRGSGADGSGGGADAAASGGEGDADGNGNSIPPAFIFMPVLGRPMAGDMKCCRLRWIWAVILACNGCRLCCLIVMMTVMITVMTMRTVRMRHDVDEVRATSESSETVQIRL